MLLRTTLGLLASAAFCFAGTVPMGSLTSFGSVRLSGLSSPAPRGATVFSGDTIDTGVASAIFTLNEGDAVFIGANASVRVAKTQNTPEVEMVRGMSRVQVRSKDLRLMAAKWILAASPDAKSGRTTADVLRDPDGTVSLSVKEGEMRATDTRGRTSILALAGHPVLLPSNPEALPSDDPPAPSQGSGSGQSGSSGSGSGSGKHTSAKVIGAYVLGAAAIGVAAAAIASREGNEDIRNQVNALTAQNAALQRQVQSLLASLQALQSFVVQQAALLARLNTIIGQLVAAQAQLAALQSQINAILIKVANGTATPADLATLASLQAQQATLTATINSLAAQAADIIQQINNLRPPVTPTLP